MFGSLQPSGFFAESVSGMAIHSAYFETTETVSLMRDILTGIDRGVLETLGRTKGNAWPVQPEPA